MNKISAEHLRAALVYTFASRHPIRFETTLRVNAGSTGWSIERASWGGKTLRSSTRTWALRDRGRLARGSSVCCVSYARVGSAQYSVSKHPGSREMVAIGIHCLSSAVWSTHYLSTLRESMIPGKRMTGGCWA
jgi:hypothetical protein